MRLRGIARVSASGPDFLTPSEAAARLNVSTRRVAVLRLNGHLVPAVDSRGVEGVTSESVNAELRWRETAPLLRRATRPLVDIVSWIS